MADADETTKKPFSFAIVPPGGRRNYFIYANSAEVPFAFAVLVEVMHRKEKSG